MSLKLNQHSNRAEIDQITGGHIAALERGTNQQHLAPSGTVTLDCTVASVFEVTAIAGDVTLELNNPAPEINSIALILVMDGTGGHAVNFGASFGVNNPPIFNNAANKKSQVTFVKEEDDTWNATVPQEIN